MAESLDHLSPQERAQVLLARLRGSNGSTEPTSTDKKVFDKDLIPDAGIEKSKDDEQMDALIEGVDIVDAYSRYIGKMQPDTGKRSKEGVMISCPLPEHRDENPSAWLNTDKNLWFCGGCQVGGDTYDLAAIGKGYSVPEYRNTPDFRVVKHSMADDYGFQTIKGLTGEDYFVKEEPESLPDNPSEETPAEGDLTANPQVSGDIEGGLIENSTPDNPANAEIIAFPGTQFKSTAHEGGSDLQIDWESIIPKDTFLYEWMKACTVDDLPHEYYFWLGLQALGFAAGTQVLMDDFVAVKANLFLCLYGPTGVGKSRALKPYMELLKDTMDFTGYTDKTQDPEGVMVLPSPNSSEALVDSFKFEVIDPSTGKVDHLAQINGLLRIEEFSSFIARSMRRGSSMKETLIEMYDVLDSDVTLHSRTGGLTIARNPYCQVVTTTQPKAIHAFLNKTDTESGMLNRWVFAAGKPRKAPISYQGGRYDLSAAKDKFRTILAWTSSGRTFELKDEALQAWSKFFDHEIAPYRAGIVDREAMVSRIDLTLKKIIVLLTINERQDQPTASIVEKATSLYRYLSVCYSGIVTDLGFNEVTNCQERILDVVKFFEEKHQKAPSRRDIARYTERQFDSEIVLRSLRNLLDLEIITEQKPKVGQRGRPTVRYSYANE